MRWNSTCNGEVLHTQVKSRAVPVTPMFASEIDAPLRGGPWIAIYDPLLKGGHRTAMYTVNGRARIPGRFAIDFIALPQGGACPGNARRTPTALAPTFWPWPMAPSPLPSTVCVDATPPPITLELAPGNHVAIDLGRQSIRVLRTLAARQRARQGRRPRHARAGHRETRVLGQQLDRPALAFSYGRRALDARRRRRGVRVSPVHADRRVCVAWRAARRRELAAGRPRA